VQTTNDEMMQLVKEYSYFTGKSSQRQEDKMTVFDLLWNGIMEAVADCHSKNLASEVAKGKKERTQQGFHNNIAHFG
jgi:hypothetical protein